MAFWKNTLVSMGMITTLFTSSPAVSTEPKEKQKIEQTIEDKLKEDLNKPQKNISLGIPGWTILDTGINSNFSIYFKLPNNFHLNTDGTLTGQGFKWNVTEEDFSFNNMPIMGYFKSLEDIEKTYMKEIMIGNTTLESFINLFNSEKGVIGDSLLDNIYGFKKEILHIYKDLYSEEFVYGLISSMITGNIDEYLDEQKVSEKQKKETKEAFNDFLNDMDYVFNETQIDDIIKGILDNDPFDSITLKKRSLRNILDLAEGFGNLMDVEKTDNSISAKLKLKGKGKAEGNLSFSYKVKLGDKIKTFDHILSSEYRCFGQASFDLNLKFKDGSKISEVFDIDPMLIFLYDLYDIDIHLKDIYLNANLKVKSELFEKLSEAFELSDKSKFGKKGFGIIYEKRNIFHEKGDISLDLILNTGNIELTGDYKELWKSMMENRNRNLIYAFSQENKDLFWYLISAGIELNNEKYTWQTREINNGIVNYKGNEINETLSIIPRLNFVAGLKGNVISPFVSFRSFPESSFKVGTFLNFPHIAARVSIEQLIQDTNYQRLLIHPFNPPTTFTLEAYSALFDKHGNNKLENYFIQSEQIDASPLPSKITAQDQISRRLFSDLNGILLNVSYSGHEVLARSIYCADSSFFVGGGYFSDVLENLHGVDFAIGYEDFLLKARYGYANAKGHYSHLVNFSAGGNINDLLIINLDLRAFFLKDTEAKYQGVEYNENDVQATINLMGYF
ncbi:MAG: hypothetical protein KKB39_04785 [Nanoarchaeota archaeon]|nr:hypothetical protein [Nanoarchaeota archaeon]